MLMMVLLGRRKDADKLFRPTRQIVLDQTDQTEATLKPEKEVKVTNCKA